MQNEISEVIHLIKNRNIDKAFSQAKKIYETNNNNKQIVNILSYLYIQRGQFSSSIDLLEAYHTKHPNQKDFDYYANMGISLKSNEDLEKSIDMYNQAKKINPDSPLCYIVPAEIYLKIRKFNLALEQINLSLEKIKLSENYKSIHFQNAIKIKTEINMALNRPEENDKLLIDIINKKFLPDIFYLLATSNPKLVDTSLINKAENHLKIYDHSIQNSLDRFWKIHPLYFGLAAAYNKKDKKKSEYFYRLANKETMKTLRYNSFDYQKQIVNIIEKYQIISRVENNHDQDTGKNNFFILGSPRSGTTLIESFIGSCEEVISGGELLSVPKIIEPYVQGKETLSPEKLISKFINIYLSRTNFIRQDYDYIIDKLPENFLYIGYLLKFFPNCKIIRTFRHPWDVAVSLFKQRYVTNIPYSASFFNIGVFMANFEAINIYWDQQIKTEKKDHLLDIRYEDFVERPSDFQKNIYGFLGLKSEFDEDKRRTFFSQTASIRQISSPINQDSIKKEDFIDNKNEFYDALTTQRKYWQKKGINAQSDDFFGYKLD